MNTYYDAYFSNNLNDHRFEKFFNVDKQGCLTYHILSEEGYHFFLNAFMTLIRNGGLISRFEDQAKEWFEAYMNVSRDELYDEYSIIESVYSTLCGNTHVGCLEDGIRIIYSEFISNLIEHLDVERSNPNAELIKNICEKEHHITLYTNDELAMGYPIVELHRERLDSDTLKLDINEERIEDIDNICNRVTEKQAKEIAEKVIMNLMKKIYWSCNDVIDLLEGRRTEIDVVNEQMECARIKGKSGIKIKGDDRYVINCDEESGLNLERV